MENRLLLRCLYWLFCVLVLESIVVVETAEVLRFSLSTTRARDTSNVDGKDPAQGTTFACDEIKKQERKHYIVILKKAFSLHTYMTTIFREVYPFYL